MNGDVAWQRRLTICQGKIYLKNKREKNIEKNKIEKKNLQQKDIGIWRRGAKEGGQKTGIDQDDDLKSQELTYDNRETTQMSGEKPVLPVTQCGLSTYDECETETDGGPRRKKKEE